MTRSRLVGLALCVGSTVALLLYVWQWTEVDHKQIGRSDFTSTYLGATLWSQGHHQDLYDSGLQSKLHPRLIFPDTEGNLPFVNPPLAAVVASPLSSLSLDAAYRVWSFIQFLATIIAVVAVAISARREQHPPDGHVLATTL